MMFFNKFDNLKKGSLPPATLQKIADKVDIYREKLKGDQQFWGDYHFMADYFISNYRDNLLQEELDEYEIKFQQAAFDNCKNTIGF
jgi:predicted membrane protein